MVLNLQTNKGKNTNMILIELDITTSTVYCSYLSRIVQMLILINKRLGSLCGLSMVDKSVELLGNPNKVKN